MMEKLAERIQQLNVRIKESIARRDNVSLQKYAAGLQDLLMYYTYTQGHARRIFGNLQGEPFEIIQQSDQKVLWDPARERIFVRYFLQPEYLQIGGDAMPVQSWAGPYLKRVSGNYLEGYFSKITSDEIDKKVEEIAVYPFDIFEFFKEQTIKQNLDAEDKAFYTGLYGLIRECEETVARRSSIVAVQGFSNFDNTAMVKLTQKHVAPIKRFQPREYIIMPEGVFLEFGKIPQTSMDRISRDAWDNNVMDKEATNIYGCKTMRVDDATYLTFNDSSKFSKFANDDDSFTSRINRLSFFGYDMTNVTNFATLKARMLEYGVDLGDNESSWNVDSFTRVLVLPPRNFLGKALLWGSDIKTTLKYENEHVQFHSSEWLAYIFHNKFAPTALDIWFSMSKGDHIF